MLVDLNPNTGFYECLTKNVDFWSVFNIMFRFRLLRVAYVEFLNLAIVTCCWNARTELCRFSGAKIYPGKGIRFVRSDSQVNFLFPKFWTFMSHCFSRFRLWKYNIFSARCSCLLIQNARGTSTTDWSRRSLPGRPCTGSNIRRWASFKLLTYLYWESRFIILALRSEFAFDLDEMCWSLYSKKYWLVTWFDYLK